MSERPGRKALFSGAATPAGHTDRSTEEIAQHVQQLNEEIASSLNSAIAGSVVGPLDAARFGAEYATLINAVNTAVVRLAVKEKTPVPVVVSAAGEVPAEREEELNDMKNRLDVMVTKNPIPMLITTPAYSILEANDAYIQMSGMRQDQLKGTSLAGFKLISQSGEGAKVALQLKRRSFGEITIELPSGRHVLEQYCIPVVASDRTVTYLP